MEHYLILSIIIFLAGLVPAFGPPSWIIAVFFYQHYSLNPVFVVPLTAAATTLGRLTLAVITQKLRQFIPKRYLSDLEYSQNLLKKRRNSFRLIIGLFIISPLPSAQLFEAAGLINIPLLPLGLAFFLGRLVSLSTYVGVSHLAIHNINDLWQSGFNSPWAIAAEIFCILCLIALFNIRWIINKFRRR